MAEAAAFDWHRWDRVHRTASRRFDCHAATGVPVKDRWARYDRLMAFARNALERSARIAA